MMQIFQVRSCKTLNVHLTDYSIMLKPFLRTNPVRGFYCTSTRERIYKLQNSLLKNLISLQHLQVVVVFEKREQF